MSHDYTPEEWAEMDGRDVLRCLQDYDREYVCEGDDVPWMQHLPANVLADALYDTDLFPHTYAACYEGGRRLEELAAEVERLKKCGPRAETEAAWESAIHNKKRADEAEAQLAAGGHTD